MDSIHAKSPPYRRDERTDQNMNGKPEHGNPIQEQSFHGYGDHEPVLPDSTPPLKGASTQAPDRHTLSSRSSGADYGKRGTRAGTIWAAVGISLAVMVVLIVFILQNQDYIQVRFFGLVGSVPAGVALVIGAVAGGILVGAAGAARILQLRMSARRLRKTT